MPDKKISVKLKSLSFFTNRIHSMAGARLSFHILSTEGLIGQGVLPGQRGVSLVREGVCLL